MLMMTRIYLQDVHVVLQETENHEGSGRERIGLCSVVLGRRAVVVVVVVIYI